MCRYKQQQQQQRNQQAAKAAAQGKSLKRQQTYQQQQQQQGSPLRRSVTSLAQHQQQQGPGSPVDGKKQQQQGGGGSQLLPAAAAGAGGGSNGSFSSGSGNRRNAAIAKFLGQLNEKKDALSHAIKTSPLSKGPEPGHNPSAAGFSRHLAGTFGDKAAGFSQRRQSQTAAAESDAQQELMRGLTGVCAAGGSGELHPDAASVTSSSNAPAAAYAAAGSSGSAAAAGDEAAAVLQPHSPQAHVSQLGLQGRTLSTSSTGSGGWSQQEMPQDGQLKARWVICADKLHSQRVVSVGVWLQVEFCCCLALPPVGVGVDCGNCQEATFFTNMPAIQQLG